MIYESVGWDGLWEMSIASMPRRNGCPISSSGAILVIVCGYKRSRTGDYIVLTFLRSGVEILSDTNVKTMFLGR